MDEFKRAHREARPPHHVQLPTWLSAMLADANLRMGRYVEGLHVIDAALGSIERTHEHLAEAELYRLKGELLLVLDGANEAQAEGSFRAALNLAHSQNAKSWELRATTRLARLLRDTNRRDEARALLSDIYNWFTEGFDSADLKDANTLLKGLSR